MQYDSVPQGVQPFPEGVQPLAEPPLIFVGHTMAVGSEEQPLSPGEVSDSAAPLTPVLGMPFISEQNQQQLALWMGRSLLDGALPPPVNDLRWVQKVNSNYHPLGKRQTLPDHTVRKSTKVALPDLNDFPVTAGLDWSMAHTAKPFVHQKVIRRDCFAVFYVPMDCPCGVECHNVVCPFSHSILEKSFHPILYRSRPCAGGQGCIRERCSFVHSAEEDKQASSLWLLWEDQWAGWRANIEVLREFCRDISPVPLQALMLLRGLTNVQNARIERSTTEELMSLKFFEELQTFYTDWEMRLSAQPLNPLYGLILEEKVVPTIIDFTVSQMLGAAGARSTLSLMKRKLGLLRQYWTDLTNTYKDLAPNRNPIHGRRASDLLKSKSMEVPGDEQLTVKMYAKDRMERRRRSSQASTAVGSSRRSSLSLAEALGGSSLDYDLRIEQRLQSK